MRSITKLLLVIFALLLIFIINAEANSKNIKVFKCSGGKVERGDTTYSVFKRCGEPAFKEILSNEGCDKEEKWHYDCTGRGNVEELIFKKGILVDRIRGEKSTGVQNCR